MDSISVFSTGQEWAAGSVTVVHVSVFVLLGGDCGAAVSAEDSRDAV